MDTPNRRIYAFEGFLLDADALELRRGTEHVPVPPKAIELLALLAENGGRTVETSRILDTVWKDTFVETGSVNYTVTQLRKILGSRELIKSVPRRGYRLNSEIRLVGDSRTEESVPERATPVSKVSRRGPLVLAGIALGLLVVIAGLGLVGSFSKQSSPIVQRNIRSVAVLPFAEPDSADPNRAISLALTNTLIQRFGRINRFRVRPLELVRNYRQSGLDARGFGEKLKADAVVEGTVRSEGESLMLTVRLLDVRDGAIVWESDFTARAGSVLSLPDEIADRLVQSLVSEVTSRELELLSERQTESIDAYRAYVRGRAILDQRNPGNTDAAESEFLRSVGFDPAFAAAYAGLAEVYAFRGFFAPQQESAGHYKKARTYAQRSLELQPDLAEGYAALGRIKRTFDWDWDGALADLRRAQELNPNLAQAYLFSSQVLAIRGDLGEAKKEIETAAEIDPISQWVQTAQFPILEGLGEFDQGLAAAESMYLRNKSDRFASRVYATFLYHKREYARVIEIAAGRPNEAEPQPYVWYSLLEASYRATGDVGNAERNLVRLEEAAQKDTKALYSLAMNYAESGRSDEAFEALDRCHRSHEERLMWVRIEPRFGKIRPDPRFGELLLKMNLR